jgi:hypothetical protein
MNDAIALKKMKFRKEPRRGDQIIAQGPRASASPWVVCRKISLSPGRGERKFAAGSVELLPPLRGLMSFQIADPGRRADALALGYYLVAPSGLEDSVSFSETMAFKPFFQKTFS